MSKQRRQEIRKRLRQARRELDPESKRLASVRLRRNLSNTHFFNAARHIAAYLPADGEIDPGPVIETLWHHRRTVYLPVVLDGYQLAFARFDPDTRLRINRYGIAEPVATSAQFIPVRRLDLVLMPVVAFDAKANRIGMGGGYYDRCFAFLRHRKQWMHPRLVGLAYDFQKIDNIAVRHWDIPAWRIVTDLGNYPQAET